QAQHPRLEDLLKVVAVVGELLQARIGADLAHVFCSGQRRPKKFAAATGPWQALGREMKRCAGRAAGLAILGAQKERGPLGSGPRLTLGTPITSSSWP